MLLELATGKKTVTGGMMLARILAAEGVDKVFGIIDGTYFGFYSSLKPCGIDLVSPRHETCAAHMAGAYARVSGKLGVCMASNGPGVANILPGVAVEEAEGNRVLLITSARRTGTIDPDRGGTFQSFPQTEVTGPMTKWACRVPSIDRLPELARKAMRVSWKGRPGVVHLDIPEDILNGRFDDTQPTWQPHQYRAVAPIHPAPSQVEAAAEMLVEAETPIIHAGSGVIHAGAYAELDALAKLLHTPVTTSWAGRACVRETEGYAVPMQHIEVNNEVRNRADLVLVLGSRLGETDWWGKAPYWRKASEQQVIQVDIDDQTLGVNRPCALAILADVKVFLRELIKAVEKRKSRISLAARRKLLSEVQDLVAKSKASLAKKLDPKAAQIGSGDVVAICNQAFGDDAIVIADGGNTAVWASFFTDIRSPNTLLGTFKMGMLGAGTPQALGAKVAAPDREVYCLTGDGSMGMQIQELETAVRCGIKVTFLVFCDKQWGMVKMNQSFTLKPIKTLVFKSLGKDETINTDFEEIRFDLVAQAMGAHGERVRTAEELKAALGRCKAFEGPSVIHVDVDPVKHMWAPGLRAFKDMHCEPKGA